MTASEPRPERAPLRRCRCGHDRTHARVHQEPKFSVGGWLLMLLMGATPDPIATRWICADCGELLATKTLKKKR